MNIHIRKPRNYASSLFLMLVSQSGAFQFTNSRDKDDTQPEWLVRQFAKLPKSDISFYLDVGLMENPAGGGTTLLRANRHHDPVHWRRTLPDALIAMLAR